MMKTVGEDNQVPMNIGLIIPGQPRPPAEPLKLVLSAREAEAASYDPAEEKRVVDAQGEVTSSMTWQHFVERRPFSCEPRAVTVDAAKERFGQGDFWSTETGSSEIYLVLTDMIEDIKQATAEFVGEVAELAELIGQKGVAVLWGENRTKLIDECGDVLFTGTWLIEAWSRNPPPNWDRFDSESSPTLNDIFNVRPVPNRLLEATDTELYRFEEGDVHANIAMAVLSGGGMALVRNRNFVHVASRVLTADTLQALTCSGLTANAAKKLAYQHREQDATLQIERVLGTFYAVNFILCMANSSIEEAMIVNRAKIDARYPEGYKPGGGVRS